MNREAPRPSVSPSTRTFVFTSINWKVQFSTDRYELLKQSVVVLAYNPSEIALVENRFCPGNNKQLLQISFVIMVRNLISVLARFFGIHSKTGRRREQKFKLMECTDRASAASAAKQQGVASIIRNGKAHKWLLFTCPCGCNQQIALNLMQSHTPHWEVEIRTANSFTVYPSVDATKSGAHFWLRDGKVIWCEQARLGQGKDVHHHAPKAFGHH